MGKRLPPPVAGLGLLPNKPYPVPVAVPAVPKGAVGVAVGAPPPPNRDVPEPAVVPD